ncbi:helix-turn-helix domain-containing protein [Bacteroidota bacterium]
MENTLDVLLGPVTGRLDALLRRVDSLEDKLEKMSPSEEGFLTVNECAAMLDLKRSTIYRMTSDSRIPHFKQGGRVYFSRAEILQWIRDSRSSNPDVS